MISTSRKLAAWMLAVAGGISAGAAHAETFTLSLNLPQALSFRDPKGTKTTREDLQLDVVLRDGKADRVAWGFTPALIGQEHVGQVSDAKVVGDAIELRVKLSINHNRDKPTILGGTADLTLKLKREGAKVAGTYTATLTDSNNPQAITELEDAWGFGQVPGDHDWAQPLIRNKLSQYLAAGDTSGSVNGAAGNDPLLETPLTRVSAGEHPRLVFRRNDLSKLRARAETPEGRKLVAEMKALLQLAEEKGFAFHNAAEAGMGNMYAAGHGLLYQLTGDKAHAMKAQELAHANLYGQYWYGGWGIHAYTLMGIALSYDLCYDAWDPETRDMMYCYLEQNIRHLAQRHDPFDFLKSNERYTFANDHSMFSIKSPRDAEGHKFRAAAAISALAILNDPVPAYKPSPPEQVKIIEPATDYQPWIGVPVVPFESDFMPRDWLVNGPFLRGTQDECMKGVGGFAGVRPEPGTIVSSDGVPVDFRRYRPAGHDNPMGPAIYVRTCGVYWGSGTGGGYGPGITLQKKWASALGRRLATNVAIYTVIDNDRERVIQACPNWRSASIGNRMWINGTQVKDGQLVRLRKGLYPLMVDVQLVGGYSAQAPKLREYTPREYAKDMALFEKAQLAGKGADALDNQTIRNTIALARSVRRYMGADIGPDGWNVWETQESLLPFMQMYRHAVGADLARGGPLEKLLPLATRLRGHGDARMLDYMASQSAAFTPDQQQPILRWYLDTYSHGIKRPFDAVIALATHPIGAQPKPPETMFQRAGVFGGYDVHAFRSGWSGSGDTLVTVDSGAAPFSPAHAAGHLMIHGLGRPWVHARDAERFGHANVLAIKGFIPTRARQLHAEHHPDGSGAVALEIDGFKPVETGDDAKKWTVGSKEEKDLAVTRTFLIDYSGKAGVPVLVVVADRISGAAHREKIWRFDIGNVGFGKTDERLIIKENTFTTSYKPNNHWPDTRPNTSMKVTFLPQAKIDYTTRTYNKEGTMFILEAHLEREVKAADKVVKGGPDALGGTLDHAEFIEEVNTKKQAAGRKEVPPVTVFTVLTLQEGPPPAASLTPDGTVKVGGRTVRLTEGKLLVQ